MMKNIVVALFLIALASVTFAENDDIFDVIAGGAEEYEFVRYSPEEIQLKLAEDMLVACENGLCTIFAIAENGDEFNVTFNAGYSSGSVSDSGVSSDGLTSVTESAGGPSVGITLSYTHSKCTQKIQVPRSIYIALNTYMYSLVTENGEPQRTMMPATEAMIVFYSTIMKQATGCNK